MLCNKKHETFCEKSRRMVTILHRVKMNPKTRPRSTPFVFWKNGAERLLPTRKRCRDSKYYLRRKISRRSAFKVQRETLPGETTRDHLFYWRSCMEFDVSLHPFPFLTKKAISCMKDSYFKKTIATFAFCLEGRDEDELPECLLGGLPVVLSRSGTRCPGGRLFRGEGAKIFVLLYIKMNSTKPLLLSSFRTERMCPLPKQAKQSNN